MRERMSTKDKHVLYDMRNAYTNKLKMQRELVSILLDTSIAEKDFHKLLPECRPGFIINFNYGLCNDDISIKVLNEFGITKFPIRELKRTHRVVLLDTIADTLGLYSDKFFMQLIRDNELVSFDGTNIRGLSNYDFQMVSWSDIPLDELRWLVYDLRKLKLDYIDDILINMGEIIMGADISLKSYIEDVEYIMGEDIDGIYSKLKKLYDYYRSGSDNKRDILIALTDNGIIPDKFLDINKEDWECISKKFGLTNIIRKDSVR